VSKWIADIVMLDHNFPWWTIHVWLYDNTNAPFEVNGRTLLLLSSLVNDDNVCRRMWLVETYFNKHCDTPLHNNVMHCLKQSWYCLFTVFYCAAIWLYGSTWQTNFWIKLFNSTDCTPRRIYERPRLFIHVALVFVASWLLVVQTNKRFTKLSWNNIIV
jgi:hypothetical protein